MYIYELASTLVLASVAICWILPVLAVQLYRKPLNYLVRRPLVKMVTITFITVLVFSLNAGLAWPWLSGNFDAYLALSVGSRIDEKIQALVAVMNVIAQFVSVIFIIRSLILGMTNIAYKVYVISPARNALKTGS